MLNNEETHRNNWLNDLPAKEWIKRTRSWFVADPDYEPEWSGLKEQHPGTYPKAVPKRLIETYSKEGMTILDPMMGSGSTLIAAAQLGRYGVGIDLYQHNVDLTWEIIQRHYRHHDQTSLTEWVTKKPDDLRALWSPILLCGDSIEHIDNLQENSVDYVCFSPPYADTLHKSHGGVLTRHKKREALGLALTYGDDPGDVGNQGVESWLDYMIRQARSLYRVVRPRRYMTQIIQNDVRIPFSPIAWRLALAIHDQTDWVITPEQVWCQESKQLRIHGYPSRWLTSNHHHYVLNFQKVTD